LSINIPENATEIFNRMAVDLREQLNELDPFVRNSFVSSLIVADANAIFEVYKTLEQLIIQTFWDTATGEFLERWAAIYGITRLPATKASGFVTLTGIDTSVIASGSQFTSDSGNAYQTLVASVITATDLSVSSLTRISQTATVITSVDHGFASNMEVLMSGAVETEFNGTFVIVVTGLNSFTYTVSGTPSTPATGTILASATFANVDTESLDFGAINNLISGTSISLSSPIAGVDNDGFVSFDEIGGGADEESDDSLRDRFLFRVQNPISLFNDAAIEIQAKTVPGVTRVFVQGVDFLADSVAASSVTLSGDFAIFTTATPHGLFDGQPITTTGAIEPEYNVTNEKILVIDSTTFGYVVSGSPSSPATGTIVANFGVAGLGQVRVFFVRDNDTNIIPTVSEVADVFAAILEIKPAQISETDVIVAAPIPVTTDFTFIAINPNTQSMRDATTATLENFFASGTSVAQDITELDYQSLIINTVDSTGQKLISFTLSTPIGDIEIEPSELAVLGVITFP